MKDWLRKWWTGRTAFEKVLLAISLVLALALIGVTFAWRRSLVPWAADWGNYAEWAGAVATLLGFLIAAYALRKNAKDEIARREEHQKMDECVKYFWPRHDGSSWPHPVAKCGRAGFVQGDVRGHLPLRARLYAIIAV